MARKSRRTLPIDKATVNSVAESNLETSIRVVGYVRLSAESIETDSIETQLLMIRQYVGEHPEFELVDNYVDNGFSGTNFERPGFNRMIEDIKHGKIQCVIVKDLSRFGRNYIETGYYIETIFPQLNVRLISINDRFDSSREGDMQGLRLPIKNMINSMYAMDLSKRFSDAYDLHFRLGDYKLRESAYGYILDKKNNKLVVDPETAGIVKLIFKWYLMGYPKNKIAQFLNMAEVALPCAVKQKLQNKTPNDNYGLWTGDKVYRILILPTYTGDTVLGRKRRRMYNQDFCRTTNKEEWFVHPMTHAPLVSHRDFDAVEESINNAARKGREQSQQLEESKKKLPNCFRKKVVCAECGITMSYQRMSHSTSRQDGYAYADYVCTHARLKGCGKRINEDYLKMLVYDQIKLLIKLVCDQKELTQDLLKGTKKVGRTLSLEKKINNVKRKLVDVEKTLEQLYVDYSEKTLGEEEYKFFQIHYLKDKEELLERLKELKSSEELERAKIRRFWELQRQFESFVKSTDYNQTIVDELIDTIYLGANNEIEVRFKCDDVIAEYMNILEVDEGAN